MDSLKTVSSKTCSAAFTMVPFRSCGFSNVPATMVNDVISLYGFQMCLSRVPPGDFGAQTLPGIIDLVDEHQ